MYPEQLASFIQDRPNIHKSSGCGAPFTNMYFGHSGKVVACCYNRLHILGTYPQQSIKQIWIGEKAEQLRDSLKQYDYSTGCQNCLHQIIAGNLSGTKANNYDGYGSNSKGYPTVMEFELSNTCNLECVMCNGDYSSLIRKNRENRDPLLEPYDTAFVDQLEEFIPYLEEVKFYGGEPFLIDIYYDIWERIIAIKPDIRVQIQTNGTVLHKRTRTILEKGNFYINVSLDSVSKGNCERIRVNSKFEHIMDNIAFFRQYCRSKGTDFRLSSCIMQQNYWEAADLIRFANSLDTEIYFHTVYHPSHTAIHKMAAEKIREVYTTMMTGSKQLDAQTPVEILNKKTLDNYVFQVEKWLSERESDMSLSTIDNLPDLLKYVNQQVDMRYDLSESNKKYIKETVHAKLTEVNNILSDRMNITVAIMDLINKQDLHLASFTDHIIWLDIDEISNNIIKYYSGYGK